MAPEKRCVYEILGLNRHCSTAQIRSAYKKQALQLHPDKLIQTGIPEEEAIAVFQELVDAYELLSDPRERTWYDTLRYQIRFCDAKSSVSSSSGFSSIPDLFPFFSRSVYSGYGNNRKGFFKVYGNLFGKIYAHEVWFAKKFGLGLDAVRDAPLMGKSNSEYPQVLAFYNFWFEFRTVINFCWVKEFDVLAGPNRKSQRVMEEENKNLRKKAMEDYDEIVRGLAELVRKRDIRVSKMHMKRNLELKKAQKNAAKRVKWEKARLYEEELERVKIDEEKIDEADDDKKNDSKEELNCVICSRKFKFEKQWKNHQQSRKHREKVAELEYESYMKKHLEKLTELECEFYMGKERKRRRFTMCS